MKEANKLLKGAIYFAKEVSKENSSGNGSCYFSYSHDYRNC